MGSDVIAGALLAVSLTLFAAMWFSVMSGRYRARRPVDVAAFDRLTGVYMVAIGALVLGVIVSLFLGEGTGDGALVLAGLPLGGWAQERTVRQTQRTK